MKIRRITNGNHVKIHVYYKSGMHRTFTEKDNLPYTIVVVLLDGNCRSTVYRDGCKIEDYE